MRPVIEKATRLPHSIVKYNIEFAGFESHEYAFLVYADKRPAGMRPCREYFSYNNCKIWELELKRKEAIGLLNSKNYKKIVSNKNGKVWEHIKKSVLTNWTANLARQLA